MKQKRQAKIPMEEYLELLEMRDSLEKLDFYKPTLVEGCKIEEGGSYSFVKFFENESVYTLREFTSATSLSDELRGKSFNSISEIVSFYNDLLKEAEGINKKLLGNKYKTFSMLESKINELTIVNRELEERLAVYKTSIRKQTEKVKSFWHKIF